MRLSGDTFESSAAGANERCDFLLVGCPPRRRSPILLGYAYHTTNVVKSTWSARHGQVYPESRILWSASSDFHAVAARAWLSLGADFISAPMLGQWPLISDGLGHDSSPGLAVPLQGPSIWSQLIFRMMKPPLPRLSIRRMDRCSYRESESSQWMPRLCISLF